MNSPGWFVTAIGCAWFIAVADAVPDCGAVATINPEVKNRYSGKALTVAAPQ